MIVPFDRQLATLLPVTYELLMLDTVAIPLACKSGPPHHSVRKYWY